MSLAQLEKVIEILTARERPENPTVEDSRAGFEKMMRMIGGKTPAECSDRWTRAAFQASWYLPGERRKTPPLSTFTAAAM